VSKLWDNFSFLSELTQIICEWSQLLLRQHCHWYRRWCQDLFEERLVMATCLKR